MNRAASESSEIDPIGLTIGFLGSQKWGSDPRALATAFRSLGHCLIERSYDEFLPQAWSDTRLRILRKLARPVFARDYNRAVLELLEPGGIDFLLVFKGMLLRPDTLLRFREADIPCYLFYPDVSFHDHGDNIPECLRYYDRIFSTKSFHLEAPLPSEITNRIEVVHHGADPEVHRPVAVSPETHEAYQCDVSFVGCWSPKKEAYLNSLLEGLPSLDLAIWGPGWCQSSSRLQEHWRGRPAWGDELVLIYRSSKINLGLLSEAGTFVSSGDSTTARTWQIPFSESVLLHEDTPEVRKHFEANREIALFSTPTELCEQAALLLGDATGRSQIARAGRSRAIEDSHTYLPAASRIEEWHRKCAGNSPRTEP